MPRIAFFPDSFHEVNGVAHTARQFVAFARQNGIPMLCLHAGFAGEPPLRREGSVERLALDRGYWSVRLEQDLTFDPFFARHLQQIGRALRRFKPDVIHITGPSELGLLGSWFSRRLGIPRSPAGTPTCMSTPAAGSQRAYGASDPPENAWEGGRSGRAWACVHASTAAPRFSMLRIRRFARCWNGKPARLATSCRVASTPSYFHRRAAPGHGRIS